jgi:hypothetical protein
LDPTSTPVTVRRYSQHEFRPDYAELIVFAADSGELRRGSITLAGKCTSGSATRVADTWFGDDNPPGWLIEMFIRVGLGPEVGERALRTLMRGG